MLERDIYQLNDDALSAEIDAAEQYLVKLRAERARRLRAFRIAAQQAVDEAKKA